MLVSDSPIKTAKEDLLNRKNFSISLANAVIAHNADDAFTIGINGKWGSGKTSVINMILESVEARSDIEEKIVVLRFNPWLCSEVTQLVSQFFVQLSAQIKRKNRNFAALCKLIDEYAEVLDFIPVAGKLLSTVARKTARVFLKGTEKSLQSIKEEIREHLLAERLKIVVAIDDIDRLSSEEICAVFRLVKSLADFPRTVYVLAMDQSVVVQALNEVQRGNGLEYLQKIIQVPFDLPAPDRQSIYRMFFSSLDSIFWGIDSKDWDSELWSVMFHFGIKNFVSSIRDSVRLTSVLSLKYSLLKDEVNVIDLIALSCIQVHEPSVYAKLIPYKEMLCDENHFVLDEVKKSEKLISAYNDITSNVSERNKTGIAYLLSELFPVLKSLSLSEHGGYRHINKSEFLAQRAICHIKYFDRYFALALDPSAILQAELQSLLHTADNTLIELEMSRVSTEGRITQALEVLQAKISSIGNSLSPERAEILFIGLVKSWQHLKDNDDKDMFSLPFDFRLLLLVDSLMLRIDANRRAQLVSQVFEDVSIALSTVFWVLRYLEDQHNRFTEKHRHYDMIIVDEETLLKLETVFLTRVNSALGSSAILDYPIFLNIIWLAEKIKPDIMERRKDKLGNR